MWGGRRAYLKQDAFADAEEYYREVRGEMREKADHNKLESQIAFVGVIVLTLLVPLFVTLGEGWWLGKFAPATLSVGAAAASIWLQVRKPQRLWALYRRAQRELEREKIAFDFGLKAYGAADDRDRLLVESVSEIAFRTHEAWEGLVPEPERLSGLGPTLAPGDRAPGR